MTRRFVGCEVSWDSLILVGGFNPFENMLVNRHHFLKQNRGENKNI